MSPRPHGGGKKRTSLWTRKRKKQQRAPDYNYLCNPDIFIVHSVETTQRTMEEIATMPQIFERQQ
jgi:hypothetical protein